MNAKLVNAKNFVVRNRTAILVAVTATAVIAIQQVGLKQHNQFLKDHDLYEKFYTPEDCDI